MTAQSKHETLFDDAGGRRGRTINSMLWAAWADAVGFISELVDDRGLLRRTGGRALDGPLAWTRRVGGRGGVDAELPAGCWSDDTQLRMATSRAIGPRGFDVEAFAKIELPVWPAYALGGGRASKAAAANLGKAETLWYANTFNGWADAGGNGVAMRIQPHVWSAADLETGYQRSILVNAVTTHGHPRAIVGALFHAATLAYALRHGAVPDAAACVQMAEQIGPLGSLVDTERYLAMWKGLYEQTADRSFDGAWKETVGELVTAVGIARSADGFEGVVDGLHLREKTQRGSGILTPVAAAALAGQPGSIESALLAAANAVGTDTDTIATMAGAILGAARPDELPPSSVLDDDYLRAEAVRLSAIAQGETVHQHRYPDLLRWVAPQTQADALVVGPDGELVVEGLGPAGDVGRPVARTTRGDFGWQWVQMSFGQTLLIKRRMDLRALSTTNGLAPPPSPPMAPRKRRDDRRTSSPGARRDRPKDRGIELDLAIDHARRHLADDESLGYTVRRVARDGSFADLVALVTAIRDDLRR